MTEKRLRTTIAAFGIALLQLNAVALADETAGVRTAEHLSVFTDCLEQAWRNPALLSLRYSTSLTAVGGDFIAASDYTGGRFTAATYQRLNSAVVTGHVSYDNGRYRKGLIYETDDIDRVGPYALYASGPGTLNKELYAFGGSYTATLGAWNIGLSGSYEAGMSYRTVDPRPKNVTGMLTVTPAGSLMIAKRYLLTVSATYMKYKQTNNLKFVSELGQNTIYHMTGLGNSYGRFEGGGASTYYTGYSFGGEIGVMPVENGFYLLTGFERTKITNILSDYNNLPMAHTSTPRLSVSAGWHDSRLIVGVKGVFERRRGTENIFGDPVSGQYPRIGALTLYSRTMRELGLVGRLRHKNSMWGVDAGWESMFEQHVSPLRHLERQRLTATVLYQYQHILPGGGYIGVIAAFSSSSPVMKQLTGLTASSENLIPVVEETERVFNIYGSQRFNGHVEGEMLFPLKDRWMLGGNIAYSHDIDGTDHVDIGVRCVF